MMRQYEAVYIMDPMLEEDQQTALVERFHTLVQAQGGEVQHLDRWERRRLAYEIKGRREGLYVVMNFKGVPATEAELGRVLGITDGVIRHMIVKMDDRKAAKAIAEAKVAAEARTRAEAEARAAAEAAEAAAAAAAASAAATAASAAPPEPVQAEAAQAEPVQAEPVQAKPAKAKPAKAAPTATAENAEGAEDAENEADQGSDVVTEQDEKTTE